MDITVIHGQNHKGSTYHITEIMKQNLSEDDTVVHEYFMPNDAPGFCVGCFNCIQKGEQYCPHAEKVQEIVDSMCLSDVIIIDSPNYCFEMTGQLKTLFDHMAYMWLSHRPRKQMFNKVGIVVSTAAGGGAGSVTKSIARQLFWWGVPKVYRLNFSVNAMSWKEVPDKIREKIRKRTDSVTRSTKGNIGKVKPNFKLLFIFNIMRKMQSANTWNMTDREHWKENRWLEKARPWRE
jgi:Multimeric flavodoxin WrbA